MPSNNGRNNIQKKKNGASAEAFYSANGADAEALGSLRANGAEAEALVRLRF
jgi:hypothetical protein